MPILSVDTSTTGLVGVLPSVIYINTNDTYATVTTSGYLNASKQQGQSYSNEQMALVYTTDQGVVWLAVEVSGSTYSLAAPDSPGETILPTIANHLIVSTNTIGTLANLTGIAINGGSIQAGLAGTAGSFISYPPTSGKGQLILTAVNNTGNTATTISNDAMGQASVVNIPDPANAIGQFMIGASATPFVSGNLPQASGTAGLMVDSGVTAASISTALKTQTAIVTMNAATVATAYATPVQIVAAPASGFALMPIACQIITVVAAAFTLGGVAILEWGSVAHGGGTAALDTTTPSAEITAAASQIYTQYGVPTTTATAIATANGLGLFFSNATQAFAGGAGSSVTIAVTYMVVPV